MLIDFFINGLRHAQSTFLSGYGLWHVGAGRVACSLFLFAGGPMACVKATRNSRGQRPEL